MPADSYFEVPILYCTGCASEFKVTRIEAAEQRLRLGFECNTCRTTYTRIHDLSGHCYVSGTKAIKAGWKPVAFISDL